MRENFNAPYMAVNLSEFWQRWHMSLTSWLNDYIFIPLTWSRWINRLLHMKEDHKPVVLPNILIVFIVSGLWHGSTLNFLIWGLIHGLLRVAEELLKRKRNKKKKANALRKHTGRFYVFMVSCLTHVFFRAKDPPQALYVLRSAFSIVPLRDFWEQVLNLSYNNIAHYNVYRIFLFSTLLISLVFGLIMEHRIDTSIRNGSPQLNGLQVLPLKRRWIAYWFMAILTALYYLMTLTASSGVIPFIYQGY